MAKSKSIILFFIFQIIGIASFIFTGKYFDSERVDGLIYIREFPIPMWQYVIYYIQMGIHLSVSILFLSLYRKKITRIWEYILLGISVLVMLFVFSMNLVWALVFVN